MNLSSKTLGTYLKEQRELRGFSLDEAALETNIAKKYIEALERDEYGFFPAEMYATGFLSTYIEVLELDREYVISMYQRAVNKEKEVPLDILYTFHQNDVDYKKYFRWFFIGLGAVGCVALLIWLISLISFAPRPQQENLGREVAVNVLTLLQGEVITFGINDRALLMNNGQALSEIEFLGYGSNEAQILFKVGQNEYNYKVGDNLNINLEDMGLPNLSISINDISDNSVDVAFAYVQNSAQSLFDSDPYLASIYNEVPLNNATGISNFTATIMATRPVWVEIQTDDQEERQQFLNTGQSIPFSFVDGAKILLGNAGAATITFGEFTNVIRGGTTGETSQSIFYKKPYNNELYLYRAQLK